VPGWTTWGNELLFRSLRSSAELDFSNRGVRLARPYPRCLMFPSADRPVAIEWAEVGGRRWIREQGFLDRARLVFIDATAVTTNMMRLNGWNPRGERLVSDAPMGHWQTVTFIAGLASNTPRKGPPWIPGYPPIHKPGGWDPPLIGDPKS
jgi:hypothetical protein